jgi:heme-degrading monooxygenase HmoA
MIARLWSARTTPQNSPAYQRHFKDSVLPELRGISGYIGANLLKREIDGQVEIIVITLWTSFEAIDAFAKPDREAAVVASHAAAVLTTYDRRVRHYEVATIDGTIDAGTF